MTSHTFRRRLLRWPLLATLAVFLGSCASNAPQDSLDPAGMYARRIHELFGPVMIAATFVFFLVQALIVISIVKFRRRDGDDEIPDQTHGNTRLELGWTIVPALVLGVVAFATVPVIFLLDDGPEDKDMTVRVTGQQFWWGYEYPEHGDIVTANELHIPAGQDVFLELESRDVIHSFWTPRLNGKRDVTPGRTHTWSIKADQPGVYSGQCAEFCGTSHPNMRLKVVAHTPAAFDEWVENQQDLPEPPTDGLAAAGFELFEQRGCAGCHEVRGQYEEVADTSPPAPDLTHLFTRDCFAGCIYDLNDRNEVEEWLRDPQRKAGSLMVIGELSEEDIDALYAYLETLR